MQLHRMQKHSTNPTVWSNKNINQISINHSNMFYYTTTKLIVSNTLQKRLLSLTNNFELVFIEVKSVLNYRLMSIRIHYMQRKADANKTC